MDSQSNQLYLENLMLTFKDKFPNDVIEKFYLHFADKDRLSSNIDFLRSIQDESDVTRFKGYLDTTVGITEFYDYSRIAPLVREFNKKNGTGVDNTHVSSLVEILLLNSEITFFKALFESPEMEKGDPPLIRFCENEKAFEVPLGLHPQVSGLYVRHFYSKLFDNLAVSKTRFQVVTGNPGTGKTFFGFYVLRKFISQQRPVLYEPNLPGRKDVQKTFVIYKIMPNNAGQGVSIKKYDRNDLFKNLKQANIDESNFVHIVDGHEPIRFGTVPLILITSNRRMNLEEFKKGTYKEWFMPLWSLEELLEYSKHFYPNLNEAVINRLFEHWNGLIRYVIIKSAEYGSDEQNNEQIVARVDKEFESAIKDSNIKILEEYIYGQDRVSSKDEEVSNRIVLLNISTSTFMSNDTFMTDHARKQVLIEVATKCQAELLSLLDCIPNFKNAITSVSTKLNGVFEEVATFLLSLGGTFDARKMVDKDQQLSPIIKISFPKREITKANYTSYSKLQDKAAQSKQEEAKDIVSTITSSKEYTNMLFSINHSFPTFDSVCYFSEGISHDDTVEKGPCTFQLTVGASHSNNVTCDSYNLFKSLYSLSNQRKIKHFMVVVRSNFESYCFKKSFVTNDPKLVQELFEKTKSGADKNDADKIISEAEKVITEAEKATHNVETAISEAKKAIFKAKKLVADKTLSEELEQRLEQYCLKIK